MDLVGRSLRDVLSKNFAQALLKFSGFLVPPPNSAIHFLCMLRFIGADHPGDATREKCCICDWVQLRGPSEASASAAEGLCENQRNCCVPSINFWKKKFSHFLDG